MVALAATFPSLCILEPTDFSCLFILSGWLVCGCFRTGYTIMAKDRYGCAGRRSKGTC
jgi:hypothetical protein